MDFFNKIWKCIELRESLQERRLSQIQRLNAIVEKTDPGECPEVSSRFFVSYLQFSLKMAKVTVGNLDCDEASKQLSVIDNVLTQIESKLPLCKLTPVDMTKIFSENKI